MSKFLEYLNSKKKINSPKVKVVADEVDMPKDRKRMPPKGVGMVDGKQPYLPDNGGKPKFGKGGLGEQKSPNVPYYDATHECKPAKLPTAEAQSPFELAPVVRESILTDPRTAEAIVRDLKRNNLLGVLVGELLTHKETYQELAAVMGSERYGQETCNRLVRAIREMMAPPLADELDNAGHEDVNLDPDAEEENLEDPDLEDEEDEDALDPTVQDPLMGDEEMVPPALGDEEEDPLSPVGHVGPDVPPVPAVENLLRSIRTILRS